MKRIQGKQPSHGPLRTPCRNSLPQPFLGPLQIIRDDWGWVRCVWSTRVKAFHGHAHWAKTRSVLQIGAHPRRQVLQISSLSLRNALPSYYPSLFHMLRISHSLLIQSSWYLFRKCRLCGRAILRARAHKLKQAKQLKLKSDVAQFTTTFKPVNNQICCKTGLMWVAKRAISLFNMLYSNVARQVARFCCPFLHTFTYLIDVCVYFVIERITFALGCFPTHTHCR